MAAAVSHENGQNYQTRRARKPLYTRLGGNSEKNSRQMAAILIIGGKLKF